MTTVSIVYHSGYGHTTKVAEAIAKGATEAGGNAHIIEADKIDEDGWKKLDASDAIVFGAPTYMGSVSGPFKVFMDATSKKFGATEWKDKIAAAFTNSASYSGDKSGSIQQIFTLAMQQRMIWVGQGENAPSFNEGEMPDPSKINRLGSWTGLMTQSNHTASPEMAPPSGDLETARLFGKRITDITKKLRS